MTIIVNDDFFPLLLFLFIDGETKWKTLRLQVFLCSRRDFSNQKAKANSLTIPGPTFWQSPDIQRTLITSHFQALHSFLALTESSCLISLSRLNHQRITDRRGWLTFVQEPFEMSEDVRQGSQLFAILKQLCQVVGDRLWRLDLLMLMRVVRVEDVICHHHHFDWIFLWLLTGFKMKALIERFTTRFNKSSMTIFFWEFLSWLFEFSLLCFRFIFLLFVMERISKLHETIKKCIGI